eukprot:9728074-Lingulodinium_polyedra.AAC.1
MPKARRRHSGQPASRQSSHTGVCPSGGGGATAGRRLRLRSVIPSVAARLPVQRHRRGSGAARGQQQSAPERPVAAQQASNPRLQRQASRGG